MTTQTLAPYKSSTLKIIEEIINETCYGIWPYGTVTDGVWAQRQCNTHLNQTAQRGPPDDVKCPVPDENYAGLPLYKVKTWVRYGWYDEEEAIEYEECEWINITDEQLRGNYIIRETSTCDELVLDQAPLN